MILGRVIQGAGGGIFPLAFSIIRDEFPNERVPGAIGLVSSLLGIGGGAGVVLAGIVTADFSYHWLFWFPLGIILATAFLTWRYIPESPVKTPADINYRAAALMTVGHLRGPARDHGDEHLGLGLAQDARAARHRHAC